MSPVGGGGRYHRQPRHRRRGRPRQLDRQVSPSPAEVAVKWNSRLSGLKDHYYWQNIIIIVCILTKAAIRIRISGSGFLIGLVKNGSSFGSENFKFFKLIFHLTILLLQKWLFWWFSMILADFGRIRIIDTDPHHWTKDKRLSVVGSVWTATCLCWSPMPSPPLCSRRRNSFTKENSNNIFRIFHTWLGELYGGGDHYLKNWFLFYQKYIYMIFFTNFALKCLVRKIRTYYIWKSAKSLEGFDLFMNSKWTAVEPESFHRPQQMGLLGRGRLSGQ